MELRDLPTVPRYRYLRLRKEIYNCTACALSGCSKYGPVPMYEGTPGKRSFTVLGEAPGKQEAREGTPFVGPAGKKLRFLVYQAGLEWREVSRVNTVACWPATETEHGGNRYQSQRAPKPEEMGACRHLLLRQLEAAGNRHVLLVGTTALKAWRPDLKLNQVRGRVFTMLDRYVVMATFHPAAILRDRMLNTPAKEDFLRFAQVIQEPDPLSLLGFSCIKCDLTATSYDVDGVPWCERHLVKWGGEGLKARQKWEGLYEAARMERLF